MLLSAVDWQVLGENVRDFVGCDYGGLCLDGLLSSYVGSVKRVIWMG